jgi:hypothetical protein
LEAEPAFGWLRGPHAKYMAEQRCLALMETLPPFMALADPARRWLASQAQARNLYPGAAVATPSQTVRLVWLLERGSYLATFTPTSHTEAAAAAQATALGRPLPPNAARALVLSEKRAASTTATTASGISAGMGSSSAATAASGVGPWAWVRCVSGASFAQCPAPLNGRSPPVGQAVVLGGIELLSGADRYASGCIAVPTGDRYSGSDMAGRCCLTAFALRRSAFERAFLFGGGAARSSVVERDGVGGRVKWQRPPGAAAAASSWPDDKAVGLLPSSFSTQASIQSSTIADEDDDDLVTPDLNLDALSPPGSPAAPTFKVAASSGAVAAGAALQLRVPTTSVVPVRAKLIVESLMLPYAYFLPFTPSAPFTPKTPGDQSDDDESGGTSVSINQSSGGPVVGKESGKGIGAGALVTLPPLGTVRRFPENTSSGASKVVSAAFFDRRQQLPYLLTAQALPSLPVGPWEAGQRLYDDDYSESSTFVTETQGKTPTLASFLQREFAQCWCLRWRAFFLLKMLRRRYSALV